MLPVEEKTRQKEAVICFAHKGDTFPYRDHDAYLREAPVCKRLVIKLAPKWTKKFLDIYVPCRDTMPGFTIFGLVLDLRGFKNRDSSHEMFSNSIGFTHKSRYSMKTSWKPYFKVS